MEPVACTCRGCHEFRTTDGQLRALQGKYKGQQALVLHLAEARRELKKAWVCFQTTICGMRTASAHLASNTARAGVSATTARSATRIVYDTKTLLSMDPARAVTSKKHRADDDLENSGNISASKRARIESLIDTGRALANARAAARSMERDRPISPSAESAETSTDRYRPPIPATDRYRPLPPQAVRLGYAVDSYRPPSGPRGFIPNQTEAGPPAHWRGGWDRKKDSILVPKVNRNGVQASSSSPRAPSVSRNWTQRFHAPRTDMPDHNPRAENLLRSSPPLLSGVSKSVAAAETGGRSSPKEEEDIMSAADTAAATRAHPHQQLTVAPLSKHKTKSAREYIGMPTKKDPRADSLGCATFGDDARCSACDNGTSEAWSLCMCNDRLCCECMIEFQLLEQSNFCATCGDTADLILTDSVELRHEDFMFTDIFMRDPAVGLRYSTKNALQTVVDRLQDVPWCCDLWKGRGSTTMARAFVWYE